MSFWLTFLSLLLSFLHLPPALCVIFDWNTCTWSLFFYFSIFTVSFEWTQQLFQAYFGDHSLISSTSALADTPPPFSLSLLPVDSLQWLDPWGLVLTWWFLFFTTPKVIKELLRARHYHSWNSAWVFYWPVWRERERERTTTVEWANALKGKGKELGGISGHCDMARGDGTICLASSRVSTKLSQNYLIIPSRSRTWNVFSFWSASAWRNELGRPAKPLRRLLEGLLRDLVWWCTTHSTWDVEAGAFPWVEARMGDKSQTQVQKNTS